MHPDLSPHLHTEECNNLTIDFKNCNIEVRNQRCLGSVVKNTVFEFNQCNY